jgi:hypothetical protein
VAHSNTHLLKIRRAFHGEIEKPKLSGRRHRYPAMAYGCIRHDLVSSASIIVLARQLSSHLGKWPLRFIAQRPSTHFS